MADYNADELVSGATGGTVGSPFGGITGDTLVAPGDIASVGQPINFIRADELTVVRPIVYRFRGYYVGGSAYEFWTGVSLDTPNPSGNPLINRVVDSVLS